MRRYLKIAGNIAHNIRARHDAYIVGYPKVGNTWMQVMVRYALVRHFQLPEEWMSRILGPRHQVPRGVPAIDVTHCMPRYNEETAEGLCVYVRPLAKRPVVLLIRNPGDALVSLYHHNACRVDPPLFSGTGDEHALSPVYGIDKYIAFHRRMYEQHETFAALSIISYEQQLDDPVWGLRTAFDTIGLDDIDHSTLLEAAEYGSFENMRQLEDRNALDVYALQPAPTGHEQGRKVRRGGRGEYLEVLSPEVRNVIRSKVDEGFPAAWKHLLSW